MNSPAIAAVRVAMLSRAASIGYRSRPPSRPMAARGFTLIEIILALSILAIGLGLAMQIATASMRNARIAAQRTEAALYAKSLLDTTGVGERVEEGENDGEFNEDFRWRMSVSPYEIETDVPGLEAATAPVELYRIELVVTWGDRAREQEARFVTLRALLPDAGG